MNDNVNHPKHYTFGKYEVIDVIEDWNLDFLLANCIKYIARSKHKGNELEDLKKAQFYLNRKIDNVTKHNLEIQKTLASVQLEAMGKSVTFV